MPVTDPIADMLTCIRNAAMAGHRRVDVPKSKMKMAIAEVLVQEKYIANFKAIEDDNQGLIRMYLRYNQEQKSIIRTLSRVSKPGRRVYVRQEDVPQVLGGLGTAIISTSQGILTGKEAVKRGLGGELVATIS
jgi:small subunit ribosomal protein S8